jgi:hypothetical protein
MYSTIWTDNYFRLDPGEIARLTVRIRADMTGIDLMSNPKVASPSDVALEVGSWNAPALQLKLAARP